jgi:hypothetical protein
MVYINIYWNVSFALFSTCVEVTSGVLCYGDVPHTDYDGNKDVFGLATAFPPL